MLLPVVDGQWPFPANYQLAPQTHAPFGSSEKTCPVRAVKAWWTPPASARLIVERVQPKRLSAERVALIVKRRAKEAGQDPARYEGHSLRAGLATRAAAGGASERVIMAHTCHRSADMVRRYIREANLFAADNAASLAGL